MAFMNGFWIATIPASTSQCDYLNIKIVANNTAGIIAESEIYPIALSSNFEAQRNLPYNISFTALGLAIASLGLSAFNVLSRKS